MSKCNTKIESADSSNKIPEGLNPRTKEKWTRGLRSIDNYKDLYHINCIVCNIAMSIAFHLPSEEASILRKKTLTLASDSALDGIVVLRDYALTALQKVPDKIEG